MRFLLTSHGMTQQFPVGDIFNSVGDKVADKVTDKFLQGVFEFGSWFADKGLLMLTEGCMVFGMFCFLMAITGKGKWMERGVKSMIAFALLGVAAHAV